MPLMSTCVARLGSRYSMILDPVRRQTHYGALGLLSQAPAELVIGIDDGQGNFATLPLCKGGQDFFTVDQSLTMTSVRYDAQSVVHGVNLQVEVIAPFWPQDEKTSLVPAYILKFRLRRNAGIRWKWAPKDACRKGVLRVGVRLGGAGVSDRGDRVQLDYPVTIGRRGTSGEGSGNIRLRSDRVNGGEGKSTDLVLGLEGDWQAREGMLEVPFDVNDPAVTREFSVALVCHMGDALFERFGQTLPMKYTQWWPHVDAVADFVRKNHRKLVDKSRRFDALVAQSPLPPAAQNLSALSFQSYLMNTMWCYSKAHGDWFSVWEGSCLYNSTVDVTYNEAMFYFACWPQLLELIFAQWSHHAADAATELARKQDVARRHGKTYEPVSEDDFPGAVLEHDMGSGWTANGQSYHHAMPVEENANFLLLLYWHARWWGADELFERYAEVSAKLAEYLLWADSTGNGFPDRGVANTIDDATPAVQYGRDNVYLGVKRLAALHAAACIFEAVGRKPLARRCAAEVRKAIATLNKGWLGDHWGVCLDKSAKGLRDCWTHQPLPYKTLPGWDAYSLYTTNGLLPLLMIDDLPPGLNREKLRLDLVAACRQSMLAYGCGHSSHDLEHVWVSMNEWRDCAGGYLGENLLDNCQRYWDQQVFGNTLGSDKPNCFTETSLSNNLVWYPRGAAVLGLLLSTPRLTINHEKGQATVQPVAMGRWPLLPLADWSKGKVPVAVATLEKSKVSVEIV